MTRQLLLLLVNTTLGTRTGTEVVTRDLALGFHARGHRVSVFSPRLGPIATELIAAGIPAVNRLEDLVEVPDLIHGHHYLETVDALGWFPGVPGVFVCHDRTAPHSIPPALAQIRRYVAVDDNCLERLTLDWNVPATMTRVMLNAVDLGRFTARGPLPVRPARALAFGSHASPKAHVGIIREACSRAGIELDVIGAGADVEHAAPESMLGHYDLVFAKARCALEAMASGAAVVLCAESGLGPMVTTRDLAHLRAWNFGARLLRDPLNVDTVVRAIGGYDAGDATAVSHAIRETASLEAALDQYEALYQEAIADWAAAPRAIFDWRARTTGMLEPLTSRIGQLEQALAGYQRQERMMPLSDAAIETLHVSVLDAPATVPAGSSLRVRAQLRNGTDAALGTWPPFPLQWAYRWRAESDQDFPNVECLRTKLLAPVPPRGSGEFLIDVSAPMDAGPAVLRVTLVQEQLRWLDRALTPIYADLPVVVTAR